MTLGLAERQGELLDELTRFCNQAIPENSIYGLLHRERDHLFPDEAFADLFTDIGRRSVPPSVVATVMVLQRLEGCSDREACDRFTFDARWRFACGVGGWEGLTGFVHTVLVDMRERLRRSDRLNRVFEVTLGVAREAGLVGRRRVLDSTALYDAVATMDTVTLVRSAIRGLLAGAGGDLEPELRAVLTRDDDYVSPGKPPCDWDAPGPGRPHRRACQRRHGPPRPPGRTIPHRRGRRGRGAPRCRGGPRPRTERGRGVPDRPAGGPRPDHLHRRLRGPPRPQDERPGLRRLQGPRGRGPRLGGHHGHRGEPGERRGRHCG